MVCRSHSMHSDVIHTRFCHFEDKVEACERRTLGNCHTISEDVHRRSRAGLADTHLECFVGREIMVERRSLHRETIETGCREIHSRKHKPVIGIIFHTCEVIESTGKRLLVVIKPGTVVLIGINSCKHSYDSVAKVALAFFGCDSARYRQSVSKHKTGTESFLRCFSGSRRCYGGIVCDQSVVRYCHFTCGSGQRSRIHLHIVDINIIRDSGSIDIPAMLSFSHSRPCHSVFIECDSRRCFGGIVTNIYVERRCLSVDTLAGNDNICAHADVVCTFCQSQIHRIAGTRSTADSLFLHTVDKNGSIYGTGKCVAFHRFRRHSKGQFAVERRAGKFSTQRSDCHRCVGSDILIHADKNRPRFGIGAHAERGCISTRNRQQVDSRQLVFIVKYDKESIVTRTPCHCPGISGSSYSHTSEVGETSRVGIEAAQMSVLGNRIDKAIGTAPAECKRELRITQCPERCKLTCGRIEGTHKISASGGLAHGHHVCHIIIGVIRRSVHHLVKSFKKVISIRTDFRTVGRIDNSSRSSFDSTILCCRMRKHLQLTVGTHESGLIFAACMPP